MRFGSLLRGPRRARSAFTLVELLVVISIIGLLATIGTANYTSSRVKSRDTRRLLDMDTLRKGLEFYANENGGYPPDKALGSEGVILGTPETQELSDAGWTKMSGVTGTLYVQNIPGNPGPFGAAYRYVAFDRNGLHCERASCLTYRVEFYLEGPVGGLDAGPTMLQNGVLSTAPPEVATYILARTTISVDSTVNLQLRRLSTAATDLRRITIDNPGVEAAAKNGAVPVAAALVVANAATAFSFANLGALFLFFFTQPVLLLKRRGLRWGVVYHSLTKLPVDLAIVRLVDTKTERVTQTKVTDSSGRVLFIAPRGEYRLEVKKPGFKFPPDSLAGEVDDGPYSSIYLGNPFTVSNSGTVINPPIPIEPVNTDKPDKKLVRGVIKRRIQHLVALSGFLISLGTFVISPSETIAAITGAHLLLYALFRRLASSNQQTEWGYVTDEKTGKPVAKAVVRLFTLPYNKLVETQVTDRRGRYNFFVGQNTYYLTVTHPGYWKTESFPLDLTGIKNPQVIAAPIQLRSADLPPVDGKPAPLEVPTRKM